MAGDAISCLPSCLYDFVLSMLLGVILVVALQYSTGQLMSLRCVSICKAATSKALRKLVAVVSAPSGAQIPAVPLTKSVLKPFELTVLRGLLKRRNKLNL